MHKLIGCFPKRDGLYKVDTQHPKSMSVCSMDSSVSITDAHCHLGHISPDSVQQLCQDKLITGLTLKQVMEITACDSCTYAKMTHKPVPKERSGKHADSPGGEVHTDMWGRPQSNHSAGSSTTLASLMIRPDTLRCTYWHTKATPFVPTSHLRCG